MTEQEIELVMAGQSIATEQVRKDGRKTPLVVVFPKFVKNSSRVGAISIRLARPARGEGVVLHTP